MATGNEPQRGHIPCCFGFWERLPEDVFDDVLGKGRDEAEVDLDRASINHSLCLWPDVRGSLEVGGSAFAVAALTVFGGEDGLEETVERKNMVADNEQFSSYWVCVQKNRM